MKPEDPKSTNRSDKSNLETSDALETDADISFRTEAERYKRSTARTDLPGGPKDTPATIDPDATASPETDTPTGLDPYETQFGNSHDSYATAASPKPDSLNFDLSRGGPKLRFRKLRFHAEGGLGRVSVAQDDELQRQVAVKEIKDAYADFDESRARFVFEAEVTGRLEHPGIVPVYALGQHADGRPYYAMRFITGEAMDKSIKQLHALTDRERYDRMLRDLLNRMVSVCNTVHYAHSRGYVHRDLKPANIMLGEYGETLVVDWGLAKQLKAEAQDSSSSIETKADYPAMRRQAHTSSGDGTHIGSVVGTAWYMSPEQAAGAIDLITTASDTYSLGATLYHILTGKAPLQQKGKTSVQEILSRVRSGDIPPPSTIKSNIPKALEAICLAAMQKEPARRYESALHMAGDLENYLADERVSVAPETLSSRVGRWMRKHRGAATAAAASLLVITGIASIAFFITQNAYTRTARLLSISQLEQEYDKTIANEKERLAIDAPQSLATPLPSSVAQQCATLLRRIETLKKVENTGYEDDIRRGMLLETWELGLSQLLAQRMSRGKHEQLKKELARLETDFPWKDSNALRETTTRLAKAVEQRIGQWYELETQELSQLGLLPEEDWFSASASTDEVLIVAQSEPGNQQAFVEFAGNWQNSTGIGVLLNKTATSSYGFVLANDSYDPNYGFDRLPTIAEAFATRHLAMFITREDADGATVLRFTPITNGNFLAAPRTRVTVRREAGTLLTFIAGSEMISFDDPFPLTTAEPGEVGVVCPSPAGLALVKVETQRSNLGTDSTLNDIERGDQAFAENKKDEALRLYERLPDSIEALFKRSLILAEQDVAAETALLREIVFDHSVEGITDSRAKQFYLYAGVRLLLKMTDSTDGFVNASYVTQRLGANFSMEDVQKLIPEYDRIQFSDMLLKPGKRSRMVFDAAEEVQDMQAVIKTYGEIFSNNQVWRRLVRWRLADAHQAQWDADPVQSRKDARAILTELLGELDDIISQGGQFEPLELTTLVRDIVWLDLLDDREDQALQLLSNYLPANVRDTPPQYLPMLIDRARLQMAKKNPTAAQRDLEYFVEQVDPSRPPTWIHHTHYGEACGILGIILRDQGKPSEAQEIWLKGRRRNWFEWFPRPSEVARYRGWDMILGSEDPETYLQGQTDGYTLRELDDFVDIVFAGSGMDDVAIRKTILKSELIPKQWIKTVAEKMWSIERGRQLGEDMLLHQTSMRDSNLHSVAMIFYSAVLELAFDGEETLNRYSDFDSLLFDLCNRLIGVFQAGKITQEDMRFILGGFTGSWNNASYVSLTEKIDDRALMAGLALVIARMVDQQADNPETCREIIERHVLPFEKEIPAAILGLANEKLLELKSAST